MHEMTKCRKCEKVVAQCRCWSPAKVVKWIEECEECRDKVTPIKKDVTDYNLSEL